MDVEEMRSHGLKVLMLLVAIGASTRPIAAQSDCGQMDTASVAYWRKYFLDEDLADLRNKLGITAIEPDAPQAVITDGPTCREVKRAAERHLRDQPVWDTIERHGWTWTVLRFGAWFALTFEPGPPNPPFPPKPGESYVLRGSALMLFVRRGDRYDYVSTIVEQ